MIVNYCTKMFCIYSFPSGAEFVFVSLAGRGIIMTFYLFNQNIMSVVGAQLVLG